MKTFLEVTDHASSIIVLLFTSMLVIGYIKDLLRLRKKEKIDKSDINGSDNSKLSESTSVSLRSNETSTETEENGIFASKSREQLTKQIADAKLELRLKKIDYEVAAREIDTLESTYNSLYGSDQNFVSVALNLPDSVEEVLYYSCKNDGTLKQNTVSTKIVKDHPRQLPCPTKINEEESITVDDLPF